MITLLCSSYNSSEHIEKYLESINNQFLSKFQVVFVDANSSDDSLEKIKSYKFRKNIDSEIIECSERIGVYAAWNKAVQASKYPYVMNYNTDDRLYPSALKLATLYAKKYPDVDLFYSRCFITDNAQNQTLVGLHDWPDFSHRDLLENCICGPFPFLKKETLIEVGMFETAYQISGDYATWLKMSKKGCKFMKIPEALGCYYHNPQGVSTDPEFFETHLKEDLLLREKYA